MKRPDSSQVPEIDILCSYIVASIAFCRTCASWRRRMRVDELNQLVDKSVDLTIRDLFLGRWD